MPLYIQSFCHPDYSQTITWPAVDVKDKVFQDTQASRSLAEDCFARNYLDGKPFTSYGMAARFVYIPFDYKPGVSSINSALIPRGVNNFATSSCFTLVTAIEVIAA